MIHRAGSLSQKYQMKIRSLRCSYVILLYIHFYYIYIYTQGKPRIQDIRISKKSCITVNLLSTIPFLSHPGTRNRQLPSMEQINLVMITRRRQELSNFSYHNTSMDPLCVMCFEFQSFLRPIITIILRFMR